MTETFAARLRRLRLARGLSQADLAAAAGASSPIAACRWETGHSHPRIMMLPRVASALGVSVDYLLTGREYPTPATVGDAIDRMIIAGARNAAISRDLGVTYGAVAMRRHRMTMRRAA